MCYQLRRADSLKLHAQNAVRLPVVYFRGCFLQFFNFLFATRLKFGITYTLYISCYMILCTELRKHRVANEIIECRHGQFIYFIIELFAKSL